MTTSTWNSPSPRLTWSITKSVVLQSITIQKLGRIQNYTGPGHYSSCAGNSPWTCSPCYDSCMPCVPPRRRTGTCRANTTGPPSQSVCWFRCETSEIALSTKKREENQIPKKLILLRQKNINQIYTWKFLYAFTSVLPPSCYT